MAKVVSKSGTEVTVQVRVQLKGSLLEMEGAIQEATNGVGCCFSEEALKRFDADGSPIRLGEIKLTARGRDPKEYQTPYGVVQVERYVYQSSRGGRIFCPLKHQARIVRGATPLFASQISHKYAQLNVRAVQTDLEQNHGRKVATSYIQNVAEWVSDIATAKEEDWAYEMPAPASPIATVVVSLDGAMIPMADSEGYREAMAGTLLFYNFDGERQHTIYLAAAPEYGKQQFKERMEREIARAKERFPDALYLGIADGAACNWSFLEQHTDRQLIDFFCLPRNTLERLLKRSTRNAKTRSSVRTGTTSNARSSRAIPKRSIDSLRRLHTSQQSAASRSKFVMAPSALGPTSQTIATRWTIPASAPKHYRSAQA